MTNVTYKILNPKQVIISIDDRNGVILFKEEFLNRGPFTQPLLDFEFFKQISYDDEQGLLVWPNTFGISIDEVYGVLGRSEFVEVS